MLSQRLLEFALIGAEWVLWLLVVLSVYSVAVMLDRVLLYFRTREPIARLEPPLVSALYWKGATTRGIVAGLVTGSLVTLFFFFTPQLRPWGLHEGILGLLVHLPVLLGVSALTRDAHPERTEAFLRAARGVEG